MARRDTSDIRLARPTNLRAHARGVAEQKTGRNDGPEGRSMRFDTVSEGVRGVPFMSEDSARFLYELIVREKLTRILELGIGHGTGTCYMAAALDELGTGNIVSVDLLEAKELFSPSPEEQLSRLGLGAMVRIVRMQTGYTWFLHDEIRRLTQADHCRPDYDLCVIDGPKNWTIDGCAFFLVDKVLLEGGWIIFDDFAWTYAEADTRRTETDGITHRLLSEEERKTPHVKEIFELLVKQHPAYSTLAVYPDWGWAVARKGHGVHKTYSIRYIHHHPRMTMATLLNHVRRHLRGGR
jgi:predicted O-methyltransferase YrrM